MARRLVPSQAFALYRGGFQFGFSLMVTASGLYHIEAVGCNAFQLVVLGTLLEASCFLFEVPTGIVADRFSRKRSLIIGLAVMGGGILLEGAFPLFLTVALAQVVWGLGATFLSGADLAWLTDETGGHDVDAILTRTAKIGTLAQLAALPLGLWLYIQAPGLPYFAAAGVLMASAGLLALVMPERGFRPSFPDEKGLARWTGPVFRGWRQIKGSRLLVGLMALTLLGGLFSEGFDRLWPVRFLDGTGLPNLGPWDARYVFLVIRGGALAVGWLVLHGVAVIQKRLGDDAGLWLVAGLNLLLAAALLLFARAVGFGLALAAFWPAQALRQGREPVMDALFSRAVTDGSVRATVLSMKGQVDQIGQIVGGPLIGYVAFRWGVPWGLAVSGLWLLPLVLLALGLRRSVTGSGR